MSRMPQIGDLLVVTTAHEGQNFIGLVYKICLHKWGHQKNVHIEWSIDSPPSNVPVSGYNKEHGYCGVNIHNCRKEFEIIRKGKKVLG